MKDNPDIKYKVKFMGWFYTMHQYLDPWTYRKIVNWEEASVDEKDEDSERNGN